MKNTRIITMLIIAGIGLAQGCEKEKPIPTLPYEAVFGTWDWVSSTTGWGVTTWADSVNYDQTLEVTRQGHYLWKWNDSIVRKEDFTVEVDSLADNKPFAFRFGDSDRVDQTFSIGNGDTLHLVDQCADCDRHVFVRRQ